MQNVHGLPTVAPLIPLSEAAIQNLVRLEAGRLGFPLWRNNVGAVLTPGKGMVRYGLANDSKKMNAEVKSSDLIGVRPIIITPDHVGQTIGQFVAREAKASDWKFTGTDRELAQLHFLEIVAELGGDAAFTIGEGTL